MPSYQEVVYEQVYKHTDLVFRLNKQGDLKYDFVLYPGANPKDIRMQWTGADSVKINSNGDLELHTPVGTMKESIPVIYQLMAIPFILISGIRLPLRLILQLLSEAISVLEIRLVLQTYRLPLLAAL